MYLVIYLLTLSFHFIHHIAETEGHQNSEEQTDNMENEI